MLKDMQSGLIELTGIKNKLLNGVNMEKIVTEIFDEIDKLLDKHAIMVPFQENAYKMYFNRALEVDIAELKNKLLGDMR